jgi:hypothetical protein
VSRETAREALAALIVTAGGFTVVNAFLPLTLSGATKVLNIYTAASGLDRMSGAIKNRFHTFHLDVLVLRAGTAADEDTMDTLHDIIVAVCVANPTNANWSHLQLDGDTEKRPVRDEGKQYWLERHKVKIKVTS